MKQRVDYQRIGLADFLVLADSQLLFIHSSPCCSNLDLLLRTYARGETLQRPKVEQCRVRRQERTFEDVAHLRSDRQKV